MKFHSTDESCRFHSFVEAEQYAERNSEDHLSRKQESLAIFHAEQDEAWGNRLVGSQTPPDYLEKENAAWQKHLDRIALIEKGKAAKWSLCRNCGREKISAGRRFCADCKIVLRRRRRRKGGLDMAQTALVSA